MKQLKVYLEDKVLVLSNVHGKWELEIYSNNEPELEVDSE